MLRTASFAGLGTIGLALAGSALPAAAAPVEGCGATPVGGTLERSADVCEVSFSAAGSYSWTVPAGLTGLYAVVAGAGGGAFADGIDDGYAGAGGAVQYVDLSAAAAGSAAQIVVGEGGATSVGAPVAGGDSSITLGAVTTAAGGAAGAFFSQYCIADGNFSSYVGNGAGAGGPAGPSGDDCATTTAPGVAPATDVDSSGDPVLAIFSTFTETLGAGGRVLVDPLVLDLQTVLDGTGRGADVQYVDPSSVPASNTAGGDGRVVFRYLAVDEADASDANDALAATGVESVGIAALAGMLVAAGGAALVAHRRRSASAR